MNVNTSGTSNNNNCSNSYSFLPDYATARHHAE